MKITAEISRKHTAYTSQNHTEKSKTSRTVLIVAELSCAMRLANIERYKPEKNKRDFESKYHLRNEKKNWCKRKHIVDDLTLRDVI